MYLMIENDGEADIKALVILGVSTARGTEKIGKFGSGFSMSINLLLRNNLSPIICCGKSIVKFGTKIDTVSDLTQKKSYEEVQYRVGDKDWVPTGYCTDFGAIDWTSIKMALREFVSNALDQNNNEYCVCKYADEVEAIEGKTRVYIPVNDEIKEYMNNLEKYFLHFSDNDVVDGFFPNVDEKTRIYRRGVLVKEMREAYTFSYNFSDLEIDECRNSNSYSCHKSIAKLISEDENLFTSLVRMCINLEEPIELCQISSWSYDYSGLKELWDKNFYGIVITNNNMEFNKALEQGKTPVKLPNSFYEALKSAGVEIVRLNKKEKEGLENFPPNVELTNKFNTVWNFLVEIGLTKGKDKPDLEMFESPMEAGKTLGGYYENDTVLINREHITNKVILEELAHHITGSTDNSRDFQDYSFLLSSKLLEYVL